MPSAVGPRAGAGGDTRPIVKTAVRIRICMRELGSRGSFRCQKPSISSDTTPVERRPCSGRFSRSRGDGDATSPDTVKGATLRYRLVSGHQTWSQQSSVSIADVAATRQPLVRCCRSACWASSKCRSFKLKTMLNLFRMLPPSRLRFCLPSAASNKPTDTPSKRKLPNLIDGKTTFLVLTMFPNESFNSVTLVVVNCSASLFVLTNSSSSKSVPPNPE